MLLLDRQTGATAQPPGEVNRSGVSVGRTQLRVLADGQVLDILPGKTTIGSSPRCNVRIEQPGVQPLHCLIVEGPDGLRVRSWVANTTLNGVRFDESALAVGDCLSLGSVELEVVDPRAGISHPTAVEAPAAVSKDAEQIRAGRDQARARGRLLLDTLRHERTTHQELCQQVATLQESQFDAIAEQNTISDKLERSLADLAAARQQLDGYRSVETERQQLAERNEQLGFEIGELSAQINELKQRQTEAAKDQQKAEDDHAALEEQHRQLIETNNRLQSEAGQLVNEKAAADEQSRQVAEQKSQLQGEFNRLADEKNALAEERRQQAEENARLQSEVVQRANEKGAADEQCRQLAEQKSQLQGDVVQLANEKAAADEQNRQLAEQKSQLQGEFNRLADEKNALAEERRQQEEVNARLQSEVVQLANEKGAADEQCRQLADQKSQVQSDVLQLANEKAAADEQSRQLAEQKSQLQNEFNRLADEKNALAEERRQQAEENMRLQSEVGKFANEKAAADEQSRQLVEQKSQLQNEVGRLTNQKDELEAEREGLRRQNEQLLSEARELGRERGSLADERTSLYEERSDLRQQNDGLRVQIAQLDQENSALVVGKMTLVEQCEGLHRGAIQLQGRVAELTEENETLAAAKATLSDEQARLAADQARLAELEREMRTAVDARESTSSELYRALLQLAELQERDGQNKAVIDAYESLSKEHDYLREETNLLKEQIDHLSEERLVVEGAWQAAAVEAATLGESQRRVADENATLVASLDEARQQLEIAQRDQVKLASAAAELESERAAKRQAESDVAAAIADGQRRLEEQERRFAEQSIQFNDRLRQQAEQSQEFVESINVLERQLAAAGEIRDSLARAHEDAQLQLADTETRWAEQASRIQELESQLAAAEVEREKAANLQAESDVAATIADGQRRFEEQELRFAEQSNEFNVRLQQQAEQSREFVESINILERQLAAVGEMRDSLARVSEEAQSQLADAESRRAEQARRIQELESQLNAAEERAAKAAELAASSSAAGWKNAASEPAHHAAEQGESASHLASDQPAEFRWSSARVESVSQDKVNERDSDEVAADVWHSEGVDDSTSDSVAKPTPDAWSNAFASGTAAEEPNPWREKVSPQAPVDASTFGADDGASLTQQPAEDPATTGQSSVWKEAAEQPGSAFVEPGFAKSEESAEREAKSESSPKPKPEPVSFIERYSHLLAEEGAASEAKPDRSNKLAQPRPIATVTQRPAEAASAAKSEEEDSLEQYMAKLLQRVRGDAPSSPAITTQPSGSPLNAPARNSQARSTERTAPLAIPSSGGVADSEIAATEAEATVGHTPAKRKVPSPAHSTDLGALRALANETARRAISRHELRKHRRNAVTKVIVGTLAGVTSLWLMLDSPDWLSIQFVTGCMSLLVAAFWAGETYRTLVESLRIKSYDGPEAGLDETEAYQAPGLPIDVEDRS